MCADLTGENKKRADLAELRTRSFFYKQLRSGLVKKVDYFCTSYGHLLNFNCIFVENSIEARKRAKFRAILWLFMQHNARTPSIQQRNTINNISQEVPCNCHHIETL